MRGVGRSRDGSLFVFDARARKNYERAFDYLAGRARAAGGIAAATNGELAADLGVHVATAQRAIAYLLAAGLIERRRVPNGDTQYRVYEVAPAAPFAPRFNGRKRRRRGRPRPFLKLLCSTPRTPDMVVKYAGRAPRSPASADGIAIAGELKRFGVAQPAAIRAAVQNSDPETVATWIAYALRSPQVRSARCYVGAMAARGARPWPSQRRRATDGEKVGQSWPGLNGAPPGRQERAKEAGRPEPRGAGGANLRRLADLAAEVAKRR